MSFLLPLLAAVVVREPAPPPHPAEDPCDRVIFVWEDMPASEVREVLGDPVSKVTLTCGQDTKRGRWRCRIWRYICQEGPELFVVFQLSRPEWVVNSWFRQ